jgi:hypothetical protein
VNIETIEKNTETLTDASKEVGQEVNVEKTKYMLVSRDQNADQTREIKISFNSFENMSQFIYLRTTVTNQNLIQEETKVRLNCGNACYHSPEPSVLSSAIGKRKKCEYTRLQFFP